MSMFDAILGQASENPILQNLAAKVGLSPEQIATAVSALAEAHPQPGDTVAAAADQTGMSQDTLTQVVEHLGGEGALANLGGLLGGQGGAAGGLAGLAGSLFGGHKE